MIALIVVLFIAGVDGEQYRIQGVYTTLEECIYFSHDLEYQKNVLSTHCVSLK